MNYPPSMDRETRDFVEETLTLCPDNRDSLSVDEQRNLYANLCRHFARHRSQSVKSEDRSINGIPIRRYRKTRNSRVQIIYFHGGGFILGGLDSHDDICSEICDDTELDVIAVDYRLAPEHKHPAALEDCLKVFDNVCTDKETILCGDSAGGWLAAMTGLARPGVALGQVLIYPMLGGALNKASYIHCAKSPLLSTAQVAFYWQNYFDHPFDGNSLTAPMAIDISESPKTVLIAAECDPLMNDVPDYAEKLQFAGVQVTVMIEEGLPHGYLRARHSVERAQQSFIRITSSLSEMA